MNNKIERFLIFLMKDQIRNFLSFTFYVLTIVTLIGIDLPLILEIIFGIILMLIGLLGGTIYMNEWLDKVFEKSNENLRKNIIEEIKKILKEFLMFIPIILLSIFITSFIMVGKSVNQTVVEENFSKSPISFSIFAIIIGPIIEEFIFRFLPYKFIKNKTLYIIVSAIIFAAMHVVNDTNPFYYIWGYMINSFYYGYRYHKTQDILVPISMHSVNNLVATIFIIIS